MNYPNHGPTQPNSNFEQQNNFQTQQVNKGLQILPGIISDARPVSFPPQPDLSGIQDKGKFMSHQDDHVERIIHQQSHDNVESHGKSGSPGLEVNQFNYRHQQGQYQEKNSYQKNKYFDYQQIHTNSSRQAGHPEQGQTGLAPISGRPSKKLRPGLSEQFRPSIESSPDSQLIQPVIPSSITPFKSDPSIGAIGVQPPRASKSKQVVLPVGPDPQACPCYLVEPNNSTTSTTTSTTPTPLIGQLGFIPVIFVPYCPGENSATDQMKEIFPTATPVPYPCNVCGPHEAKITTQFLDLNQLGSLEHLKKALSQAKLGLLNLPVKGIHRRKVKRRKIE